MSDIRQTPLRDFHLAHGGRLVPFAGWELPVQYTSILDEHRAVRERAGLFDVSHMGEVSVDGPQALDFLQKLLTNDIARIKPGQAIYSLMCQPDGGCVDDVIVYRFDEASYFICVNASNATKDIAWMQEQAKGFDCTVADLCEDYAQVAIQGPRAWDILLAAGFDGELPERFGAGHARLGQFDVILSRTGYTGEDGAEIYCAPKDAAKLAAMLWYVGEDLGLALCGLGARDSLRLEAGMPLYGHEISETISPLQAGLGWAVKLDKGVDFIGHEALAKEKAEGPARRLLHYVIEGRRIAREGTPIVDAEGSVVGEVRSGSFSPILNKPIGSALIDANADRDDLFADLRGKREKIVPTKAPLHKSIR